MKFIDFFNLFNLTKVDFDGYYGDQCVDLVQFWSRALGGPRFKGDAQALINQFGDFYSQIQNTPEAIPKEGDIVVWSSAYNGTVGHVGIATGTGDTKTFECFEQNDPLNSNCHLKTYNYNFVLGWLHPKLPIEQPQIPIFNDQTLIDLGEYGKLEVQQIRGLLGDKKRLDQQNQELNIEIQGQKTTIKEWSDFFDSLWQKLNPLNLEKNPANTLGEVQKLLEKEQNIENSVTDYEKQLKDKQEMIDTLTSENEGLSETVQRLEEANLKLQSTLTEKEKLNKTINNEYEKLLPLLEWMIKKGKKGGEDLWTQLKHFFRLR